MDIRSLNVLFFMPMMMITTCMLNFLTFKGAGAPQKIMWLFDDILSEKNMREKADIEFRVPGAAMFGVKKYSDILEAHRIERKVGFKGKQELVSVDDKEKIATFKNLDTNELVKEKFDLLHVVPPMSAPDFIKKSKLANAAGWVEVDQETLQSTKYQNVFSLGDCCSTPNSKTAAAVTKQAPIMVHNLMQHMKGKPLTAKYNGYASCPLVMGKKRVILAEFGYGGKILETFNSETGQFPYTLFGQTGSIQERFFMFLKTDGFPYCYWNMWTKGKWYGTTGPFKPSFPSE
jgi:eukaryotic sulfide quinone oxidoreductase